MEGETDNSTIIGGDLNTPLLIIDTKTRQTKTRKQKK